MRSKEYKLLADLHQVVYALCPESGYRNQDFSISHILRVIDLHFHENLGNASFDVTSSGLMRFRLGDYPNSYKSAMWNLQQDYLVAQDLEALELIHEILCQAQNET